MKANNMSHLDENQIILRILVDCIDYIYDAEEIYYAKDTPKEELEEFVERLQQKDYPNYGKK